MIFNDLRQIIERDQLQGLHPAEAEWKELFEIWQSNCLCYEVLGPCKAVSQIIIERYEAPILELKVFLWNLSGTFHLSIPKLSTVTVQAIVAGSSLEAGFFFGFNQWIIERVRSCVDPDHSNGYALLYAASNLSCFASLQMKYDSVNQCWNLIPCIKPNTCAISIYFYPYEMIPDNIAA